MTKRAGSGEPGGRRHAEIKGRPAIMATGAVPRAHKLAGKAGVPESVRRLPEPHSHASLGLAVCYPNAIDSVGGLAIMLTRSSLGLKLAKLARGSMAGYHPSAPRGDCGASGRR